MSKVSISGDNQGSGTFTIAAPNSNNNRTFSLPDEAGTALTDASDLEPQVKTTLNATGSAPVYACRAWVVFGAVFSPTIRNSGNVSSITDIGVGRFDVNFATSMPDSNYSVSALASDDDIAGASGTINGSYPDHVTTTSCRVFYIAYNSTAPVDRSTHTFQAFR